MHATSIIAGRRTAWLVALLPILVARGAHRRRRRGRARDRRARPAARRRRQHRGRLAARRAARTRPPRRRSCCGRADEGELPGRSTSARSSADGDGLVAVGGRHRRDRGRPGRGTATPTTSATSVDRAPRASSRADAPDGVTAQVTGPAAVQADLGAVFDGADTAAAARDDAIVAVLLVLTYRSPVLWLVPLSSSGSPTGSPSSPRPSDGGARRRLGRLDHRHPLRARLRRRHRLRPAADLPLPRRAAAHRVPARRDGARAAAYGGGGARRAPRPSSSACSPCCCRWCPTTRGLGLACAIGVVVAATFALRRAAGGAGALRPLGLLAAGAATSATRRWSTPTRSGTGSATGSRRRPAAVRHRHPGRCSRVMAIGLPRIEHRARPGRPVPRRARGDRGRASGSRESFPAGVADPTQVLTRADGERGAGRGRDAPTASAPRAITATGRRHHADRRGARRRPRHADGRATRSSDCATRWRRPTTRTSAAPRPTAIDERDRRRSGTGW